MSKGQRGNKEAKKPKKAAGKPVLPGDTMPSLPSAASGTPKKR